jgi:hypothetical protein
VSFPENSENNREFLKIGPVAHRGFGQVLCTVIMFFLAGVTDAQSQRLTAIQYIVKLSFRREAEPMPHFRRDLRAGSPGSEALRKFLKLERQKTKLTQAACREAWLGSDRDQRH